MPTAELHFFSADDPNGSTIFECSTDDEFVKQIELNIQRDSIGSGKVNFARKVPIGLFSRDIVVPETLVRVLIPAVHATKYYSGFWINPRQQQVVSLDEKGGEGFTFAGPGPKHYLTRMLLWSASFSGISAAVEKANGVWTWPETAVAGRILERLFQEDAANPSGPFLPDITLSFDENDDSDGVPWSENISDGNDDFTLRIGQDYLKLLWQIEDASGITSQIYLGEVGTPLIRLDAFQTFGRDLTEDVAFVEGHNIRDDLEVEGSSYRKASHALVRGNDGHYELAIKPSWSPGDLKKVMSVKYDSDSAGILDNAGVRALQRQDNGEKQIDLPIVTGFSAAQGRYFPGPDYSGSNGDFWVGDTVSLTTGQAAPTMLDYQDEPQVVTGIELELGEAVRDDNDERRARSFDVTVQLNKERKSSNTSEDLAGNRGTVEAAPSDAIRLCHDKQDDAFSSPIEMLMKFRFRMGTVTQQHSLQIRLVDSAGATDVNFEVNNASGGGWADQMGISNLSLDDADANNTDASPDQGILTTVDDVWCWLRMRAGPTQIRAKLWKDGGAEPGPWSLESDDADVNFDTASAATIDRMDINPTMGNGGSGSTLEIDSIQWVTGYVGDATSDPFTRTVAGSFGVSPWNGHSWQANAAYSVAATVGVVTAGAVGTVALAFIPISNHCIHGGPGAGTGDVDSTCGSKAAPCTHEHDYVAQGGTTGQVLAKASGADWDTEWISPSSGSGPFVDSAGTAWMFDTGLDTIESESGPGVSYLTVNDLYVWLAADGGNAGVYAEAGLATLQSNGGTMFYVDNVKHRIINGNGLVMPILAADPAGGDSEDGQVYYNSATDKFRGYVNGAWVDLATGGDLAAHVAAADPHTGYRLESADHSHATTGLQGGTIAHSATTGQTANDHHAQSHTHASHTGIGADDHHTQAHSHPADGAVVVTHASTTGQTANDHHAQAHTASHLPTGTDPVNKFSQSSIGTADQAIANTETVVLAKVMAANELVAGQMYRFEAWFTKAGTNASSAVIRIRIGTTTLTGNIAATLTPPANALAVPGKIEGLLWIVADGAGGTARGSLQQFVHLAAVTVTSAINPATATVAVNTTTANQRVELTFISGNAANTYTFRNAVMYRVA